MGETELRLRADELNRLAMACPKCQTEIVFLGVSEDDVKEIVCQNCFERIAGGRQLLSAYRTFFAEVQRAANTTFVVRMVE